MHKVVSKVSKINPALTYVRGRDPIGAMLHTTDGKDSEAWLLGASLLAGAGASADFLVKRDGTISKLIGRGMASYHAGRCRWGNIVDDNNLVSRLLVGIEIENYDRVGQEPTTRQHEAVAGLLLRLAEYYKWSPLLVYGHYALAFPMGRRSDPYRWDWGLMMWLMAHAPERCELIGLTF